MTAVTALLAGIFFGVRFGMVPKAFRATTIAIAVVLVFQTILLATIDQGRASQADGRWLYWVIQLVIFAAGAGVTWLTAKVRMRQSSPAA